MTPDFAVSTVLTLKVLLGLPTTTFPVDRGLLDYCPRIYNMSSNPKLDWEKSLPSTNVNVKSFVSDIAPQVLLEELFELNTLCDTEEFMVKPNKVMSIKATLRRKNSNYIIIDTVDNFLID